MLHNLNTEVNMHAKYVQGMEHCSWVGLGGGEGDRCQ